MLRALQSLMIGGLFCYKVSCTINIKSLYKAECSQCIEKYFTE